jgi:hypothetical protein
MLSCNSRLRPVFPVLCTFLVGALLLFPIQGQQLGTRENTDLAFSKNRDQFNKLLSGEVPPDAARDKVLLEVAGRYYVFRVTWPTLHTPNVKWEDGMGRVQLDFEKVMNDPATKEGKNKEFMKLLAHQLIDCFKKVLLEQKYDTATSTALTNAALMLPVLARCKQPEVADFLLELARTDAKGRPALHPFIRMCAIKGLGELSAPGGPVVDGGSDSKGAGAKGLRQLGGLDAMIKFVDLPYQPEGQGPEYDDALAFVRREGVKALAATRLPAYEAGKDAVKAPVAYQLLRVASGSPVKVGPPYTLSEKLEAAIGLCHLKSGATRYNVELGAFMVGKVLAEFADGYVEDFHYFSLKDKEKDAPRRQSRLPWKLYAVRLDAGVKTMVANLPKDSPVGQKLKSGTTAARFLDDIAKGKEIDSAAVLQQEIDAVRPSITEVYEGNKDFTVPLPAK